MFDTDLLRADCRNLRLLILDAIHHAGSGHTGGSFSAVEILWTLYSHILRVRPEQPDWPERDRFILSKGHAAPALYAVLATKGYFPLSELQTLRRTGSMLQGHPDMKRTPGIEMSTGSLGMGISAGIGMALGARLARRDFRVFVLVGDGELQEGQNWEALMAAAKFNLANLTIIVDQNGVQLDGTTDEVMPMRDLAAKVVPFGFTVVSCDGHDCAALYQAYCRMCEQADGPKMLIARTVKGKGVSFMEGQAAWHGKPISDEEYRLARCELVS